MTDQNITILAVDDFSTMRRIIRNMLKQLGYNNILEAEDGAVALRLLQGGKVDFVISDWNMPNMNGLDATRHLVTAGAKVKILALTVHDSREYVLELARAGARGYLLKESSPQEFIRAIEAPAAA